MGVDHNVDIDEAERLVAAEVAVTRARSTRLGEQLKDVIAGSTWTTDDDEHDPEGSTIGFERAQIIAMLRDSDAELRELDAARARIEQGTYGRCERCSSAIADPRLEAVPAARRCLACSSVR